MDRVLRRVVLERAMGGPVIALFRMTVLSERGRRPEDRLARAVLGVALRGMVVDDLPEDPHDRRVERVVTETGVARPSQARP